MTVEEILECSTSVLHATFIERVPIVQGKEEIVGLCGEYTRAEFGTENKNLKLDQ